MRTSKALIFAATCLLATSVNATLYSRLNGQAVYDSDLNITWTADANLAATLPFGLANTLPSIDSGNQPGSMFGGNYLNSWITALNAYQGTGYLGYSDWRLTIDNCPDSVVYGCRSSEFGHLFYDELDGIDHQPISTSTSPNLALFSNIIEVNWYWTGTLDGPKTRVFNFGNGAKSESFDGLAYHHVWAVRDGDIATPIPEPKVYALLLTGLCIVGVVARRRKPLR